MNDLLHALWQSSEDFYERFGMYPPDTRAQLRVMTEECFEVVEAALTGTPEEVAKEGADLNVTLMGVLMSRGVEYDEYQAATVHVINKNDAKTDATHAVNSAGKIARKAKREGQGG